MGKIIGTGAAVPDLIVRNDEISKNPDWVSENLGIQERRYIHGFPVSNLGYMAGYDAIRSSGLERKDIDMLIVATATPEMIAPSTACLIKQKLKIACPAFDINAVCAGFIYSLPIAEALLKTYDVNNILIIGIDQFSKITDFQDRNCVFFGDGAGAVVMTKGNNMKAVNIWSDSLEISAFTCENGGTFKMNGHKVYETALRLLPESINKVLEWAELKIDDITWMVPHQPSKKILFDVADKIGLPRSKVLMNMNKYANTASATIPILLHESWHLFKPGDKILMTAIGSGWTYGSVIYEV